MYTETQSKRSQFIYAVKGFAILSVICAHTSNVSKVSSMENIVAGNVLSSLGSIGVAVFFIVSGFLFANNNYPFLSFFKKKIATILIPWVVTGTVVYCYVAIRKNGFSAIDWLNFISGNKSYLYFLTVLMSCYLIAFYINKKPVKLTLVMILSIVSILLTTSKVITQINAYMNPLNWFFYFGLGYLLFNFDKLQSFTAFAKRTIFLWVAIFLVLLLVFSINGSIGYWTNEYLVFELISVICIFGICSFPSVYQSKAINIIGKESFSIYLLHMPFAGFVANVFSRFDFALITLIRPLIVLLLTVIFIYTCKFTSNKLKFDRFLSIFIGSRK